MLKLASLEETWFVGIDVMLCCFARQQVNNNTQTDNDNTHGTATPTWHVRINQHANTVKDPALRRYETRNNKLNGYPTTLKWIIQRTLVDIQLKLGGSKWILSGSKWIQNLQDPFRSDPFTSLVLTPGYFKLKA